MAISCDTDTAIARMDGFEIMLYGDAMTMQEIAAATSINIRMVCAYVASMRARRRLFVEYWAPAENGHNLLPVPHYRTGRDGDAPRPPAKHGRERQAQRLKDEAEWLAAGMMEFTPRPDFAAAWLFHRVEVLPQHEWQQIPLF